MPEENVFVMLLDAFDPIIDIVIDLLFFPVNAIIAFIWGGITEVIKEVLF